MLGKLTDTCKKIKLDHHLISYTRINPKCIKDLNVSHETMKILEEYIGSKILDISRSNIFAYMSSRTRETKEKKKQMVYIKVKNFCTAKEAINKMKRI